MLHLITFKISGKAVSRLYQVQSGSWAALKKLLPEGAGVDGSSNTALQEARDLIKFLLI